MDRYESLSLVHAWKFNYGFSRRGHIFAASYEPIFFLNAKDSHTADIGIGMEAGFLVGLPKLKEGSADAGFYLNPQILYALGEFPNLSGGVYLSAGCHLLFYGIFSKSNSMEYIPNVGLKVVITNI